MSGSRKVLIVDDEPFIVETLRFALEQAGLECVEAGDGAQAVKAAREENPHLILLDVMLPKLDGLKVCRLLRSDPSIGQVPIIMLTARTQERDIREGFAAGADEYVTKPFDMVDLVGLVRSYLESGRVKK